ncbi:hypothetical protein [Streptomyces sp. NBC_01483]
MTALLRMRKSENVGAPHLLLLVRPDALLRWHRDMLGQRRGAT